jgi:hypothetical protein
MALPNLLVNSFTNTLSDTPQVAFTSDSSPSVGTIIDSFTASNSSTANKSYKAYIVNSGGVATNPQRPFKIVVWGEIDLGAGIVGQVIPPGGTLQIEQSQAGSIFFTVTGRQN